MRAFQSLIYEKLYSCCGLLTVAIQTPIFVWPHKSHANRVSDVFLAGYQTMFPKGY